MRFKTFFTEMAMQTGDDLAMVKQGDSNFVIFRPTIALKKLLESGDTEQIYQSNDLLGTISLNDNSKAMEVGSVWAQKGYGPLLYLLAMSANPEYGLMPSRIPSQVSEAAANVWKNFANGPGQTLVTAHDSGFQNHDEPFLNKKYTIKAPHPNYQNMLNKGHQFFKNDKFGEQLTHLQEYADYKLRSEMGKIYGGYRPGDYD